MKKVKVSLFGEHNATVLHPRGGVSQQVSGVFNHGLSFLCEEGEGSQAAVVYHSR